MTTAAQQTGSDILLLAQPLRRLVLKQAPSPARVTGVRFITGMVVLPVPMSVVAARWRQPHSSVWGKSFRIDIRQVQDLGETLDFIEQLSFPLPMGHWRMHLHMRQDNRADGSWQRELLAGPLTASLSHYELFALDSHHCLLVLTHWSHIEGDNWFYRLLLKAQPQIATALPWIVVASTLAAARQQFGEMPAQRRSSYIDGALRIQATVPIAPGQQWVSIDGHLRMSASAALQRLAQVQRYPEFLHLVRHVDVQAQGSRTLTHWQLQFDLGLWHQHLEQDLFMQRHANSLYFWHAASADSARIDALWQILPARDGADSRLSINHQGDSLGGLFDILSYSPYPQIDEALIADILLMHRSRHWLETP